MITSSDTSPIEHSGEVPDTSGLAGQPKGLMTLFFTEMWERFSYYGMRAILTVFMVTPIAAGGLGLPTVKATAIYGNYAMSVYMLSIPGGYVADNFLGARFSVLIGGIVIAMGHFCMATHSNEMFFLGLGLIAIGTGLLKPNISAMVGGLYTSKDERRDAGFSIFYMGINLGAFLSPFVTGTLAQSSDWKARLTSWGMDPNNSWHWGFGAAGVGMTLGIFTYLLNWKGLRHVGKPPAANAKKPWWTLLLILAGSAVFFVIVRRSDEAGYTWLRYLFLVLPVALIFWFAFQKSPAKKRLAAILVFSFAVMIFWAIFEQAGTTIALFAEDLTDRRLPNDGIYNLFGWHFSVGSPFPSSWFQSINSLFVITLAPLFAWLWVALGKRQPSSPMKFVLALVLLCVSFILMVPAAKLSAEGKVSPWWICGLFFLQTMGELCISPVGLSTLTKLAPVSLVGLVMGIWFLAAALGNKLAGILSGDFDSHNSAALAHIFWQQAIWVAVFAVLLVALVPWIKRLMCGIR